MGFLDSLISPVLGFLGGERTNSANQAVAQQQMDFQERMSNTSYQRAVADMQQAGLSPMLAYSKGGASTPSGAMYSAVDSVSSGLEGYHKSKERDIMSEQMRLIEKQAEVAHVERLLKTEQVETQRGLTAQAWANAHSVEQDISGKEFGLEKSSRERPYYESNARLNNEKLFQEVESLIQQIQTGKASAAQSRATIDQLKAATRNLDLDSNEKEAMAKMWDEIGSGGAAAKTFMPLLKIISGLLRR